MSDKNKNKPLVLGSSTFNFIASMACRSVGDTKKDEFSSDCSAAESDKEKKSLVGQSEEDEVCTDIIKLSSDLNFEINQTSLVTDFSMELNLTTKNSVSDNITETRELDFNFKLLSKAENEYEKSSLGKENFLKGCKW